MSEANPVDGENDDSLREQPIRSNDKRAVVSKIFGTWDEEQVREFNEAIAEMDKIGDDMWK